MSEAVSEQAVTAAPAPAEGGGIGAVLRNRPFLFLWMAQLFSQLATQVINFAVYLQVSHLTNGSGTATAGIIVCFTAPAVLFSAVAGVFVERQSKKWTMVVTNVGRGVSVLFYVLTVAVPRFDATIALPILFINTLIFSSIAQFFAPAEGSMIPLIVERDRLVAANSLFNLTLTASQLIGFVFLGPLLTTLIGYKWLYVVVFALFALCAALTWRLPNPEAAPDEPEAAQAGGARGTWQSEGRLIWTEFKEGVAFIRKDAALTIAIIYWSVAISVFFMLATIAPKFLLRVLHVNPDNLYFILVPGGIGLVIGVVLVGRFASERNRAVMINYGLLAAGIGLAILALVHPAIQTVARLLHQLPPPTLLSQVVIGITAFFLGISNSFISVPAQTVLQERTPEDIRARVFGAFYTVSNIFLIIPLVIVGALADVAGVVRTVVGIAVLVLVLAGGGLMYQRRHPGSLGAGAVAPTPPVEGLELPVP